MENNFNSDLNERVLEKLEQKIAIEEFKEKEQIEKKQNRKRGTFWKVASVAIVAILLAENAYTYATYEQNIFSFILNKVGILENYSEKNIEVNDEKLSDVEGENILTLVNYGMDKETLIVNYNLQLEEKPEYFMEKLLGDFTIVDGENVYILEEHHLTSFYKINDTEYEVIKIFAIDSSKLSEDARFVANVKLYKEFEGPIEDLLGEWSFDIKLEKSKLSLEHQEYYLENSVIEFFDENGKKDTFEYIDENSNLEPIAVTVEIVELKQSDLATKLVFFSEVLYTDVKYFVEIINENGDIILENNTVSIRGGGFEEILFSRIDLNSKITVNIYGYNGTVETSKGSIELDLSKDLKEK